MSYPEALHIVNFFRIEAVHILDTSIRVVNGQVGVEALDG